MASAWAALWSLKLESFGLLMRLLELERDMAGVGGVVRFPLSMEVRGVWKREEAAEKVAMESRFM